jgi:hypothetical protein
MSTSATNGFIRYMTLDGLWKIAVYTTLALATTDAAALNTAVANGTKIVIGTDLVDTSRGLFVAEAALFTTTA